MLISVVIPCFNSAKTIERVVLETRAMLVNVGVDYEFVLVNDGSVDNTFSVISQIAHADEKIVAIDSSRNFGQHNALIAGLSYARGEFVMLMDDDMQTHPRECPKLIRSIMDGGYDVVFGIWEKQRESWWRLAGSRFAKWTMRILTDRPKGIAASNFVIMRGYVKDEIIRYRGPYVYIQGLIFRVTYNVGNVTVEHFDRAIGASGYRFRTLIKLWSNILGFTLKPLRAIAFIGVFEGILGLISACVVIINKLCNPTMVAGWPSLMAVMLICSGSIMLALGVHGEYLGRQYMISNRAPQYVVRAVIDNRASSHAAKVSVSANTTMEPLRGVNGTR